VAHLRERPHLDQVALAQDRDPVAERLDLAEDVRGQEHRLTTLASIGHALAEGALHQRVQAARRLVQQQQIGPGHQPGDQDELLAVALGVGPHLLGGIELEPLEQQVPVDDVDVPLNATKQVERLRSGERGPQADLAGHVRDATVGLHRVSLAVDAEDLRPTRGRPDQPEQQPDRRRLARAVRSQVADHLSLSHLEVEGDQGPGVAECLGQILCSDRRRRRSQHARELLGLVQFL
jgi:hypothetical protein